MTGFTPELVERVARALCDLERPVGTYDARDDQGKVFWRCHAQAALEASGIAELTEALRVVAQGLPAGQRKRIKLAEQTLAKIGGKP